MSDRAEFYRHFPEKQNQQTMREPVLIPITDEANANNGKWWAWHNIPDYSMWRMTLPDGVYFSRIFVVWFDHWGNFQQANGEGMIFYSLKCFIDHVEGADHASEVCRWAV